MELILKKTIDNLGEEGDIVNVKPGYGRNYLVPHNFAAIASKASLARLEIEKDAIEARKLQQRTDAEAMTSKLTAAEVNIEMRVGEEDKLYGSVNNSDIADKLAELGIEIDRRKIILDDPIKTLGEKVVQVKVGYQATADLKVNILPLSE